MVRASNFKQWHKGAARVIHDGSHEGSSNLCFRTTRWEMLHEILQVLLKSRPCAFLCYACFGSVWIEARDLWAYPLRERFELPNDMRCTSCLYCGAFSGRKRFFRQQKLRGDGI